MTMHRFLLHRFVLASTLAAAGCSAFTAVANPSRGVRAPFRTAASAVGRPVSAEARIRAASVAQPGIGGTRAPAADAQFIAAAAPADTIQYAHGALLDVWLNDTTRDLSTITRERSMGTAVVQGDFFRYNTVNVDPDLRSLWGRPLLLKWTAFFEVTERGQHVFEAQLSRDRTSGVLFLRTLVRVSDETVFEKDVRAIGGREFSEMGSRTLTLAPGMHKLEVWLSVQNRLPLSSATQLGTFLKIRAPGTMTAEPMQPSRIWHRTR